MIEMQIPLTTSKLRSHILCKLHMSSTLLDSELFIHSSSGKWTIPPWYEPVALGSFDSVLDHVGGLDCGKGVDQHTTKDSHTGVSHCQTYATWYVSEGCLARMGFQQVLSF